jgi:hypothetical protein
MLEEGGICEVDKVPVVIEQPVPPILAAKSQRISSSVTAAFGLFYPAWLAVG